MTISDIQQDTVFWQRMLRLAGYYTGRIDGISGKLTRKAEDAWLAASREAAETYGTFDDRTEKVILTLMPGAQVAARKWMRAATVRAAELGITVKLIDGTRSYKEQDKLFRKRPKVTNARGGRSWHNFGLAFDFGLFRGKEYLGESPHYKTLGAIASTMPGLTWGGTWVNLVDEPHIQLNLFDTVAKARAAFEA